MKKLKKPLIHVVITLFFLQNLSNGFSQTSQKPESSTKSKALIADNSINEKPTINYTLSMPQPQTHYFEVNTQVNNVGIKTRNQGYIDFKMAVWTPGSYLIREYAKNVEGFKAFAGNTSLKFDKINKNTWRVFLSDAAKAVTISYKVYAFEISVRTSYLDDTHGYVTPASMFMYVNDWKNTPATLMVVPFKDWKNVSTSLKETKGKANSFEVPNLDILIDSPIEIGNQQILSFEVNGVPHKVSMYGEVNFKADKLLADLRNVCETAGTVIGELPIDRYQFLYEFLQIGGGGLEHLNSTTIISPRTFFINARQYQDFLSTTAHEYFHLWNVKRIRPVALGPFDYENENYTHNLWVSEGFTSFYAEYILRRAGIISPETYIENAAISISGVENTPGNKIQSATEASWDAWIKHYRPNENSRNTTISYYPKGSVIAEVLNLMILKNTKGEKNLDDLMKSLYKTYYKEKGRGFKDEELQNALVELAGKDVIKFSEKYIYGTETIDYNTYFNYIGLKMIDKNEGNSAAYLGINMSLANRNVVATVTKDSPAYQAGISPLDELSSIDGNLVSDMAEFLSGKKVGDVIKVKVNHQGLPRIYEVTLTNNPMKAFKLEKVESPSAEQEKLYKKWLFVQ